MKKKWLQRMHQLRTFSYLFNSLHNGGGYQSSSNLKGEKPYGNSCLLRMIESLRSDSSSSWLSSCIWWRRNSGSQCQKRYSNSNSLYFCSIYYCNKRGKGYQKWTAFLLWITSRCVLKQCWLGSLCALCVFYIWES